MNSTVWANYQKGKISEVTEIMLKYPTFEGYFFVLKNDFNPKCKRNSSFINQLYIELGFCLATNFNPNSLRITLIITTSKLNIYNSSMKSITLPGLVIESVQ